MVWIVFGIVGSLLVWLSLVLIFVAIYRFARHTHSRNTIYDEKSERIERMLQKMCKVLQDEEDVRKLHDSMLGIGIEQKDTENDNSG